jgi:CheY-like chemotaxis protein
MARLLLLDDDPPTLAWMTAALEAHGHEVVAFTSGAAALEAVSTSRPDLIVSDVLMPEMDGLVFARLVRRYRVPVLFVSLAKKEAEAVLVGATGFLRKPASANEIRRAVDRTLGDVDRRAAILVADDDPLVRELYTAFLEERFDVVAVEDGAQALEVLRRRVIDLAIVDVHMPVINGADLVKAMRAEPRWEHIPVIVETSDPTALDAPLWNALRVSRVMDKQGFAAWLDGLLAAPPRDPLLGWTDGRRAGDLAVSSQQPADGSRAFRDAGSRRSRS